MRGETEPQKTSNAAVDSSCRRSRTAQASSSHSQAGVLCCCLVFAAHTEGAGQSLDCRLLDGADKGGAASCASTIENYSTTKKLTKSECMW